MGGLVVGEGKKAGFGWWYFGSVIVRVGSRQLTVPTDCYMCGRCSRGSVELTRVRIWFVAADFDKRRLDEVRVRAYYSIWIREGRRQYCYVLCPA